MNNITKKNNKEFIEKTSELLIELGAKKVGNIISTFRTFKLDTTAGEA